MSTYQTIRYQCEHRALQPFRFIAIIRLFHGSVRHNQRTAFHHTIINHYKCTKFSTSDII